MSAVLDIPTIPKALQRVHKASLSQASECVWVEIPGTGSHGFDPPEYRCATSSCEDVSGDCWRKECCERCGCSCPHDEPDEPESD